MRIGVLSECRQARRRWGKQAHIQQNLTKQKLHQFLSGRSTIAIPAYSAPSFERRTEPSPLRSAKEEEPFLTIPVQGRVVDSRVSLALAQKVLADDNLRQIITQLFDGREGRSPFMDRKDEEADKLAAVGKIDAAWFRQWTRIWNLNCFRYQQVNMGLFLAGSMFNHSCEPNALYQTFSGKPKASFRAVRDVALGEELTVDYTTLSDPSAEARQRQLEDEKLEIAQGCRLSVLGCWFSIVAIHVSHGSIANRDAPSWNLRMVPGKTGGSTSIFVCQS